MRISQVETFEEPRGKPRGILDRKEFRLILICSLTPQQAAENALAIAVQAVIYQRSWKKLAETLWANVSQTIELRHLCINYTRNKLTHQDSI